MTDGSYICHNGYKELVDCSGLTRKGIQNKSGRHSKGHMSYSKFQAKGISQTLSIISSCHITGVKRIKILSHFFFMQSTFTHCLSRQIPSSSSPRKQDFFTYNESTESTALRVPSGQALDVKGPAAIFNTLFNSLLPGCMQQAELEKASSLEADWRPICAHFHFGAPAVPSLFQSRFVFHVVAKKQ